MFKLDKINCLMLSVLKYRINILLQKEIINNKTHKFIFKTAVSNRIHIKLQVSLQ